jgi:hypothetical protein
LWCNRIEKEKYDSFHTLSDFIDFSEQHLSSDVAESMIEHMTLWYHAHALNVRVDLEGAVAALDGMKSEAVSTGR